MKIPQEMHILEDFVNTAKLALRRKWINMVFFEKSQNRYIFFLGQFEKIERLLLFLQLLKLNELKYL